MQRTTRLAVAAGILDLKAVYRRVGRRREARGPGGQAEAVKGATLLSGNGTSVRIRSE